ncbi:hypothetical protein MKZ38_000047 [Zalerion maritima]|uniref:Uncharacterized protein n=1 Tax=Zalerion maritima TaxID=339359 RepID=A0AAD5WST4_9PEZI|nr:hypothetical protein MKZ38_000047 [Zalerion maritima]
MIMRNTEPLEIHRKAASGARRDLGSYYRNQEPLAPAPDYAGYRSYIPEASSSIPVSSKPNDSPEFGRPMNTSVPGVFSEADLKRTDKKCVKPEIMSQHSTNWSLPMSHSQESNTFGIKSPSLLKRSQTLWEAL